MSWPTPQEYNEAVQDPDHCFADRDLRGARPELTALGLPRPVTGNFASVYRLQCSGRDWAVRCLYREYADIGLRYAAISDHLGRSRLRYTVDFQYLGQGIRVGGSWYPVVKMAWVEGVLLHEWVASHLHEPDRLVALLQRWIHMIRALEGSGVAHGDLQHGNVLVVKDDLVLVDYDGMFVPSLAGRGSHELGHPSYQHPFRTDREFGPWTDRFSAWVIAVSLFALSLRPDLWNRFGGGDECLLFRGTDFVSPASSPVLASLRDGPDQGLGVLADRLATFLTLPPDQVPPLDLAVLRPQMRGCVKPTSQLPNWVAESIPAKVSPAFETTSLVRRAIAAVIGVAAGCYGIGVPAPLIVVAAVLMILAILTVCYNCDPAVIALRRNLWDLRAARRVMAGRRRRLERWEARLSETEAEHDALMVAAAAKKRAIRDKERRELAEIRGALAGSRREPALVKAVKHRSGALRARVDAEIRGIARRSSEAIEHIQAEIDGLNREILLHERRRADVAREVVRYRAITPGQFARSVFSGASRQQ